MADPVDAAWLQGLWAGIGVSMIVHGAAGMIREWFKR